MATPVSSAPSSPCGSSTVSPASSPRDSLQGSPTLGYYDLNTGLGGVPPTPPSQQQQQQQQQPKYLQFHHPYINPIGHSRTPIVPRAPPRPPILGQPAYTKFAQINTPYDFLVSYEYFSEPRGFKPYHFRQCYMPTSSTYVIVEKGWSTQVDLDGWSGLMLRYHPQCFSGLRSACTSDPPKRMNKPKIQVCPLLSTEMQRAIDRAVPDKLAEDSPELHERLKWLAEVEDRVVFFIVVQGRDEGAAAKLVVKGSFYQIMTEIYYAASNGLSVVFSGVMREKDLPRLGRGCKSSLQRWLGTVRRIGCDWKKVVSDLKFKRVATYESLLEDDADKNVIRVGC